MPRKKVTKSKTGKFVRYELSEKERERSMERLVKLAHEIASRKR